MNCNEIQQNINASLIAFADCNKYTNSDLTTLVELIQALLDCDASGSLEQDNKFIIINYTLTQIGASSFEDDMPTLLADYIALQNIEINEIQLYIFKVQNTISNQIYILNNKGKGSLNNIVAEDLFLLVNDTNRNNYIKSNESLSLAQRKGDTLYGIIDQYTNEEITLEKTTDINTADGVIYFDLGAEKFKRQIKSEINVKWFGADQKGVNYSNTPVRNAIRYINSQNGGILYFPKGNYKFSRELNATQPGDRVTNAMYVLGDNVTIKGDGKNQSKLLFECPFQGVSDLDRNFYYIFFSHQKNFTCTDIEIMGDVTGTEFGFENFKPPEFKDGGIFIGTDAVGGYLTNKSTIRNCRLGGTRGFLYATCAISDCDFQFNEIIYCNGFNANGNKIKCNNNTWEWCEMMESAGEVSFTPEMTELGFGQHAFIEFKNNRCYEVNSVAVGGYYNGAPTSISFGYDVSNNIIINKVHETTDNAINVVNNAYNVNVSNNIVKVINGVALNIQGQVGFGDISNININGGVYETGATVGAQMFSNSGVITVSDVHIIAQASAISATTGDDGKIFINSGVYNANKFLEIGYGSTGDIIVAKEINFIPRPQSGINLDYIGGIDSLTNTLSFTRTGVIVKDEVDSNKILEYTKKVGSNPDDARYGSMYIKYANGRQGWGDPTRSFNPDNGNFNIDVYLDRKAPNTLGVDDGDSLRVGRTTTANRPSASTMGAGAIMYDTTINDFIGSDGTNWKVFYGIFNEYVATLEQNTTSNPTPTIINNKLSGAITWVRNSVGEYDGTLTGAFVDGTVALNISPSLGFISILRQSDNIIRIKTYNTSGVLADDILKGNTVSIRVKI